MEAGAQSSRSSEYMQVFQHYCRRFLRVGAIATKPRVLKHESTKSPCFDSTKYGILYPIGTHDHARKWYHWNDDGAVYLLDLFFSTVTASHDEEERNIGQADDNLCGNLPSSRNRSMSPWRPPLDLERPNLSAKTDVMTAALFWPCGVISTGSFSTYPAFGFPPMPTLCARKNQ